MSDGVRDIRELFGLLDAGRLDELTPEEVRRLETHLDATPADADRLSRVAPPTDPLLQAPPPSVPQPRWDAVWENVTAAAGPARPGPRVLRLWRPLAAVAAAVVLGIGLWDYDRVAAPAPDAWPVQWADTVEIDELESAGDTMPLVLSAGDEAVPVIWVFESEG